MITRFHPPFWPGTRDHMPMDRDASGTFVLHRDHLERMGQLQQRIEYLETRLLEAKHTVHSDSLNLAQRNSVMREQLTIAAGLLEEGQRLARKDGSSLWEVVNEFLPEIKPTESADKELRELLGRRKPEPFGWFTEDHAADKSATTYDASTADRWRAKGWPVSPLYTSPPAPVAAVLVYEYLLKIDPNYVRDILEICE